MFKRKIATLLLLSLMFVTAVQADEERFYSEHVADAPELAHIGELHVGYSVLELTDPARPNLPAAMAGKAPIQPRDLKVHVWYPAVLDAEQAMTVSYEGRLPFRFDKVPEGAPTTYTFSGRAAADADVKAGKHPLVVISHGYGNWATYFSYLAENLASKGYVVASIEHNDIPVTAPNLFPISFGDTVLNRSRDQRFVIDALTSELPQAAALVASIDKENIGLVGYSMGGFGALATAGAGYDATTQLFAQVPPQMTSGLMQGQETTVPAGLKAVTYIAPWGANGADKNWTTEALAAVKTPSLFLVGNHDDISGYEDGVKWIFDQAVNSERYMLVYQNARHSIGGNPPPAIAHKYFDLEDWFNEAVWRREKITAINTHFVTAFFDRFLKSEEEKAAYLKLAPQNAVEGSWPLPFGAHVGGTYSDGGANGKAYWKGFQRRFAIGLEMHQGAVE